MTKELFIEQQRAVETKDLNLLFKLQLDTHIPKFSDGTQRTPSYYGQVFIYKKDIRENYLVFQTLCYSDREKIKNQMENFVKDNFILG